MEQKKYRRISIFSRDDGDLSINMNDYGDMVIIVCFIPLIFYMIIINTLTFFTDIEVFFSFSLLFCLFVFLFFSSFLLIGVLDYFSLMPNFFVAKVQKVFCDKIDKAKYVVFTLKSRTLLEEIWKRDSLSFDNENEALKRIDELTKNYFVTQKNKKLKRQTRKKIKQEVKEYGEKILVINQ